MVMELSWDPLESFLDPFLDLFGGLVLFRYEGFQSKLMQLVLVQSIAIAGFFTGLVSYELIRSAWVIWVVTSLSLSLSFSLSLTHKPLKSCV